MTRSLLLVLAIVAGVLSFAEPDTGFVMTASLGSGFMAASSSPAMLFAAGLMAVAYRGSLGSIGRAEMSHNAGVTRRGVAYVIDLFAATLIIPAFLTVPLLLVEANRTGTFQWAFERTELVPTDVLVGLPLMLLGIVLLNLYFAVPVVRGTQTLGCHLVGIRIVDFDGADVSLGRAVLRSFLAFVAACAFVITLPLAWLSGDKGVLWHDTVMDTRAVKLSSHEGVA
jgi:uncharacterized RDD family membrane protein YckC